MEGLLLDADYAEEEELPIVRLFLRREKDTIIALDPNFEPYLYVAADNPERVAKLISKLEVDGAKPKNVEIFKRTFLGRELEAIKVSFHHPKHLPKLRHIMRDLPGVKEIYEFDVQPARRYLIDHGLVPMEGVHVMGELQEGDGFETILLDKPPAPAKVLEPELNVMSFDIEVYNPSGTPRVDRDPIIMVSAADNRGLKKVITWKDFKQKFDFVEVVSSEREMLRRFVELVKERDVDILLGYNTDLFDFPYMRERAKQLKVKLELGRDGSEVMARKRRFASVARVRGRPHLDVYAMVDFMATIGNIRLIHYTLEDVYKHFTGREKLDVELAEIHEAWDHGGEKASKLLEYSLSDAEATLEIGLELLPLFIELSRTVRQTPFDVSRMTPGQLVEWLLIAEAYRRGELVPARPVGEEFEERLDETYIGAYVMEPVKGLHENLVVFDFRSVAGNEPIVVSDEHDKIKIVEIGDFVDEALSKAQNKKCVNGAEIADLKKLSVLCFDENHRMAFKPISQISRHPNHDKLLKLRTRSGKSICVTPSHSVFTVYHTLTPKAVEAGKLKVGDHILVPRSVRLPESRSKTINLAHLLQPADDLFLYEPSHRKARKAIQKRLVTLKLLAEGEKSAKEISEKFKISISSAYQRLWRLMRKGLVEKGDGAFYLTSAGREYLEIQSSLNPHRVYDGCHRMYRYQFADICSIVAKMDDKALRSWKVGVKNSKHLLNLVLPLEPLAALLGWYVAEGCMIRARKRDRKKEEYQTKVIITPCDKAHCEEVCNVSDDLGFFYSRRRDGIVFSSKIYYRLFHAFECGEGAHDKRVPPLLLLSDKTTKKQFLDAYLKGDGHKYGTFYNCSTVSKDLVNSLILLVKSIKPVSVTIREETPRTSEINGRKISSSTSYTLFIYGLLPTEKRKRTSYAFRLPIEFLPGFKTKYQSVDREEALKKLQNEECQRFLEGDLALDEIVAIEEVSGHSYVYDIGVQNHQNFLSGFGWVCAHNSLYPSIIVSHNIDPSALNCDCCKPSEATTVPELGYKFCKKRKGFIPATLERIIQQRVKLKEELKRYKRESKEYRSLDAQQWALKIIANSFYGMLGYPRARWYFKQCAESVTSFGRHYIKKTIDMAKNFGFEVIYSDTDSLHCKLNGKIREDVMRFLKQVNESLPGIMELELEGFYRRGVFVTKKRYAMIDEEGRMVVKGLEFVRRDWAALAKKTQEAVLEAILRGGSPKKAADIVRKVTRDIYEGRVNLDDLVIYTQLKMPIESYRAIGPHVVAAKKLREKGREIEPGMMISYIEAKGAGSISERAVPVEDFKGMEYDADYYVGHQVLPAVMRIMEVLGYREDDLRYEREKQVSLAKFMR